MKYVINKGVRDTIVELGVLFDRFEKITELLADPAAANSIAVEASIEKRGIEQTIVGVSARLLSHATKGHRFPHMTKYRDQNW